MSRKFGIFLDDNQIPVINWVNHYGSPEGKDLRFTLPTDAKATIEANMEKTFTLKRGDDSWDLQFVSLVHHGTGTNGVRAVGRVKRHAKGLAENSRARLDKLKAGLAEKSSSAMNIPKPDKSEASEAKAKEPKKLDLGKLKAKRDARNAEKSGPADDASDASGADSEE